MYTYLDDETLLWRTEIRPLLLFHLISYWTHSEVYKSWTCITGCFRAGWSKCQAHTSIPLRTQHLESHLRHREQQSSREQASVNIIV